MVEDLNPVEPDEKVFGFCCGSVQFLLVETVSSLCDQTSRDFHLQIKCLKFLNMFLTRMDPREPLWVLGPGSAHRQENVLQQEDAQQQSRGLRKTSWSVLYVFRCFTLETK